MAEYLSWPAEGLDPYRLAAQTQVTTFPSLQNSQGSAAK
jgi:hypothetical protein